MPFYLSNTIFVFIRSEVYFTSIPLFITKKPKIKSIPYEEFTDNEMLEKLVRELNAGGANVALGVPVSYTHLPGIASTIYRG